jgi:hypothetical protein
MVCSIGFPHDEGMTATTRHVPTMNRRRSAPTTPHAADVRGRVDLHSPAERVRWSVIVLVLALAAGFVIDGAYDGAPVSGDAAQVISAPLSEPIAIGRA